MRWCRVYRRRLLRRGNYDHHAVPVAGISLMFKLVRTVGRLDAITRGLDEVVRCDCR